MNKSAACRLRYSGFLVLLLSALIALSACSFFPEQVSLSDPRVQPMLKAMAQVDRASLGFTPVSTNSQIRLETSSGRLYDAMLHVYGETSRTIGFRKTGAGYRWISEQEIHQGPGWYQSVDGTFREYIVVEYQTESVNGVPLNQIWISYTGSDTNLSGRELTLEEIQPVLSEWRNTAVKARPADLPGAGFDPAPVMFLLFMLLAFLVACCLALILGTVCIAVLALMVGAGIISTSVLAGYLRRSVSTGFRTLFIQLGALAGLFAGAVGTAGITWLNRGGWNSPMRWGIGLAIGLIIGITFAWLFNVACSRVVKKLDVSK